MQLYEVCDAETDVDDVHDQNMECGAASSSDREMSELTGDDNASQSNSSDNESNQSEKNNELSCSQDENEGLEEGDLDDLWYEVPLYENSETSVGEAVADVLKKFIQNREKKVSLYDTLEIMNKHLPKPNNLPRSKYHLHKLLDKLLPNNDKLVRKFRICEDCSHLLGEWSSRRGVIICDNDDCKSPKTNGAFYEFDLGLMLKHLFEFRNLGDLILAHRDAMVPSDDFISDISSGSQHKIWKKEIIKNDQDVFLLYNIDGTPARKSSKSQTWLIQNKICNIPVQN